MLWGRPHGALCPGPASAVLVVIPRQVGPMCLLRGSVAGFRPTPPTLRAPTTYFRGCPFVFRYLYIRTEGEHWNCKHDSSELMFFRNLTQATMQPLIKDSSPNEA